MKYISLHHPMGSAKIRFSSFLAFHGQMAKSMRDEVALSDVLNEVSLGMAKAGFKDYSLWMRGAYEYLLRHREGNPIAHYADYVRQTVILPPGFEMPVPVTGTGDGLDCARFFRNFDLRLQGLQDTQVCRCPLCRPWRTLGVILLGGVTLVALLSPRRSRTRR